MFFWKAAPSGSWLYFMTHGRLRGCKSACFLQCQTYYTSCALLPMDPAHPTPLSTSTINVVTRVAELAPNRSGGCHSAAPAPHALRSAAAHVVTLRSGARRSHIFADPPAAPLCCLIHAIIPSASPSPTPGLISTSWNPPGTRCSVLSALPAAATKACVAGAEVHLKGERGGICIRNLTTTHHCRCTGAAASKQLMAARPFSAHPALARPPGCCASTALLWALLLTCLPPRGVHRWAA